jgi:hypothetical protein
MTRVRHCLPIITAACLTSIGSVQADNSAVLREVQGTVWVNQGKEYVLGYSGMPLQPGARVLTLEGASAVVKQTDDDSLTPLESNSLFMLRELDTYQGGAATVQEIGPDYTKAIGAGTTNDDAPAVVTGATSDKEPSIDKANMALGGGTESTMGTSVDIEGISQRQQEQVVDDRPPPVSAFR